MSDERLEKIETKIAFLEDAVDDLNRTVYAQRKEIDRFRAAIESLAVRVRELADAVGERGPGDERPPHY